MLLSTYDYIASHTAGLDWNLTNYIQHLSEILMMKVYTTENIAFIIYD